MSVMTDGETPFWNRLGELEDGMPIHLPIGVDAEGRGPTDDLVADHIDCWCTQEHCILRGVLQWSFKLGVQKGLLQ